MGSNPSWDETVEVSKEKVPSWDETIDISEETKTPADTVIPEVTLDQKEAEKNLIDVEPTLAQKLGGEQPSINLPIGGVRDERKKVQDHEIPLFNAEQYLVDRVNSNPDDEDAMYQLGRTKLVKKEYGAALDIFAGLSAKNPNQPSYLQGLANAEYYLGQKEQGLKTQAEAIEKTPDPQTSITGIEPQGDNWQVTSGGELSTIEKGEVVETDASRHLNTIANGLEQIAAAPFTAPIQAFDEGMKSLEKAGEYFEGGEFAQGFGKAIQGVVHGGIGVGMMSANGLIFNSAVSLAEMAGAPSQQVFAPITSNIEGFDEMSEMQKAFWTIGDLAVFGIAMHKIGKPFSQYKEVAKSPTELRKLETTIEEIKKKGATQEEIASALQHLDNPEGAKLQTQSMELQKELDNPNLSPEVKPLLEVGKQEVDQNLLNQTKEFSEAKLQEAEGKQAVETLQQSLETVTTETAKKTIQSAIDQILKVDKEDANKAEAVIKEEQPAAETPPDNIVEKLSERIEENKAKLAEEKNPEVAKEREANIEHLESIKEEVIKESPPKASEEDLAKEEVEKTHLKIKYGGKDKDLKGEPQKEWMKPAKTSEEATQGLTEFVEASDYKGTEQSTFIDKGGENTEVKLRNDDGKWNWYYPKSKKPFASFGTAKEAISFIQKQPFWDNGELNKKGRNDDYFAKSKAEYIKREIDNGNVLEDISDGRISAADATTIIESAGLEVPKDILDLTKNVKSKTEAKPDTVKQPVEEVKVEEAKAAADKTAQENGFKNKSELLGSVNKRSETKYENVQDVPKEVIEETKKQREEEKAPEPPLKDEVKEKSKEEIDEEAENDALLKEDIDAALPKKLSVKETSLKDIARSKIIRGAKEPTYTRTPPKDTGKKLREALFEAVKNPSKEKYNEFVVAFEQAFENPYNGTSATKEAFKGLHETFPELNKWQKQEEIKRRFTTPIIQGSSFSLGLPSKAVPKDVWQRHVKKEGDIPLNVFNQWIKTKGNINAHLKQIEFTTKDFYKALRKEYGQTWLRTPKIKTETLEKINDVLERLGTENREAVLAELPENLREVVSEMRDQIDALSRDLMRQGFIDESLKTKIEENLGLYTTRSYRLHTDKGWNWETIPDEIKQKAATVISQEYPEKTVEQIEGILKSYVNNRDIAWDFAKSGTLGSKDLGITKQRKDIPIEIREFLGQFKDPIYNYATSIAKMANLVEKGKFLEKVLADEKDKWLFDERVGDYNVKIAAEGSKTLEPLNGLYTTKEIAEAFKKFAEPSKMPDWLKFYMVANSLVKYSKTILSIKTHARNFGSNFLFQIANGRVDFGSGGKTITTITDYIKNKDSEEFREYYKDLVKRGVIDESVHANELKQNLQESIDYINDFEKYGDNLLKKVGKKSLKFIEKAYAMEDNIHKVYAFETEKGRYEKVFKKENPKLSDAEIDNMAADEAAKIVRLTMPTYSEVPLFIRNLRRFPLTGTFVTFPYEVLRNGYNTVWLAKKELRNPDTRAIGAQRLVGVMTAATVTAGISLATRSMLGIGDDDEKDMRRFLPNWSKNSDLLFISNEGNGKYKYIDLGYSDPYNYIKKPFNAIAKGDRNQDLVDAAIEFVHPFLGEELLAGRLIDLSRNVKGSGGKEIYNPEAPLGERWKDITDYLLGGVEPGTVSDAKRIYKAYKKSADDFSASAENEILGVATGQRIQIMDAGKSFMFKTKKTGGRISDATKIYTTVLYNPQSTEEDKEKYYKIAAESFNSVIEDARQDYLSALNLGAPKKELDEAVKKMYLDKFKANKAIQNAIIKGIPVEIDKEKGAVKKK